jgi:hypothetical protein
MAAQRARRLRLQRRYLLKLKQRLLDSWQVSEKEFLVKLGRESEVDKPPLHIYRLLRDKIHRANRLHVQRCEFCRDGMQAATRRAMPLHWENWNGCGYLRAL